MSMLSRCIAILFLFAWTLPLAAHPGPPLILQSAAEHEHLHTLDQYVDELTERMVGVAKDLAPTPESKAIVEERRIGLTEAEPEEDAEFQKGTGELLLRPVEIGAQRIAMPEPKQVPAEPLPVVPPPEPEPEPEAEPEQVEVALTYLEDSEITTELHDDDTVLAQVARERGDLVLFNRFNIWVGGAVQVDYYRHHDLDSDSDSELDIRRGEVIVRASGNQQAEWKVQYDLADKFFRDLHWRWNFQNREANLTVGQQKEPMGLDYLTGNKFGTAMERSSPTSEFSSFRSTGARFNRWANFGDTRKIAGFSATRATASVGIFTHDIGIDNKNNSDLAVTGRLTLGNAIDGQRGLHIGIGGTYRDGKFDQIAPRPESAGAERILLASPDAERMTTLAMEGGASFGALHGQFEVFGSTYRQGSVDADGYGGYAQVGWFVTGEHRDYRPRLGLWAPVTRVNKNSVELFTRASHISGEDELNPRNHLSQVTVGVNWYFRKFRTSVNGIYAKTRREVNGNDDGGALIGRVQYLF